jgi:hypothetical protein
VGIRELFQRLWDCLGVWMVAEEGFERVLESLGHLAVYARDTNTRTNKNGATRRPPRPIFNSP